MRKLPARQVHLDFHTSPHIPGVGSRFDKAQFQAALKEMSTRSPCSPSAITAIATIPRAWARSTPQ